MKYSEEHCNQVLHQEYSIDTIICGTIGSKTKNNCSQRRLIAQWQGCVRLAVSPSWGKDIYSQVSCWKDIYLQSRPSLLGDWISHNAIPAKAHSVVLWVTRDKTMTFNDTEVRKEGSLPPSLFISDPRCSDNAFLGFWYWVSIDYGLWKIMNVW